MTGPSPRPGQLLGQGIAFPPRLGPDGRVAWSSGETNVREGMEVVLRTEPGERLRLADFGGGLRRYLFEPNATATRHEIAELVRSSLTDWEPRASVLGVEVDPDPDDPAAAVVTVAYRLVATRAEHRLALTVALGR
jgi:phage baseplate assembly protein W